MDAPGIARRLLVDWFSPILADGTLITARLLVSELVTNAVSHGHGQITLRAQRFEDRLLVEVIDEGKGFTHEPPNRDLEPTRPGGWGLNLVDTESSRWGIARDNTHVWFELQRPKLRLETNNEPL